MFLFKKKKAFTLTELLVVVVVIGVLAAVSMPKLTRVLESQRVLEAEGVLSSVRTEQERRCSMGRNYAGDFSKISTLSSIATSGQATIGSYVYTLTQTGVNARREGKNYTLKIRSYKTGEICCEGAGCNALNKGYPICSSSSLPEDECAALELPSDSEQSGEGNGSDPCEEDASSCACVPNQSKCCTDTEMWNGSQCLAKDYCDEKPEECCIDGRIWNGSECIDCEADPAHSECCLESEFWNGSACERKAWKWVMDDCSGEISDHLSDLNLAFNGGVYCLGDLGACSSSTAGSQVFLHCGYEETVGGQVGCQRYFNPDENTSLSDSGYSEYCDWDETRYGEFIEVPFTCTETNLDPERCS